MNRRFGKRSFKKVAKKAWSGVKTLTGNRYGRGTKQIITKGVPQLAKDVLALQKLINVEKKVFELTNTVNVGQVFANVNGIGIIDVTPNPAEGITYTTRNGRSIKLTGGTMNMQFSEQSAQNIRCRVKIQLIQVIGNPFSSGATMLSELYDVNPLTTIIDFNSDRNPNNFRQFKILATKPEISGSGCNFQRHCHLNVFLGVNYDFNDFIQSIHRTQRFLQKHTVEVHIIHTETERSIVKELRKKWAQHEYLQQKMRDVVSQFGLNQYAMTAKLTRSIGLNRQEASGKNWKYVNNDTVIETASMAENSVDLIVTSIPFSNH